MKRTIAKRSLREFWEQYADSKDYLETWYETIRVATWNTPDEIREIYKAIILPRNSGAVFNISGNKYIIIK
ncbi:MAG: type II toxin-antitoxin system HigB family toxin [Saprospiraceae bacterium]|nr:type II toxin-antitoxin system HigB family toxin [Saprospiraceae bacterium]